MKKLLVLLTAAGGITSANAQQAVTPPQSEYIMSRWVIDANLMGGFASQTYTTANSTANYPNALNMNTGKLTYDNGLSYGGDLQLGFFFGRKRHFGLGSGIMYMEQHGDAILDNYHAEFQSVDGAGNIFRQVVSGNKIKEEITSKSFNIPVMLKYKTRFSKRWGFSADAGAVFNLRTTNAYNTNTSFNYEAIYQFQKTDAGTGSVYDNSPVASSSDWFITRAEFLKNNPNGNVQDYFNAKRALGYRVGEGLTPVNKRGNAQNTRANVGLLIQPSINYYLSEFVALNFGAYYMIQPFKQNGQSDYTLTTSTVNYSSVLNNVTASTNQDYGLNVGARFFFGRKRPAPIRVSGVDKTATTQCLLADGSFTLHGLPPNEQVVIEYSYNGGGAIRNTTTVQADGSATVSNLGAGSYTLISATVKKQNAQVAPLVISEPVISLTSQTPHNPTVAGTCDGSIRLGGLGAGKAVSVNYTMNGKKQPTYSAIVNSDNSITIDALCEGSYSGMIATVNNCTVTVNDFILAAPAPQPKPAVVEVITEKDAIYNTPILFDFNKATIHISSYPLLNEASKEMKEQHDLYIRVDAHADAVGSNEYNQKLSERRASSVKAYMKNKGANPARIKVYGHGETEPAATNDTEEGRAKNRRAVINKTSK
jgi:outer membrane protein OmpA-like peptidoglycan-associated protein